MLCPLPQEIPRFHFDYFGPAMMSVFIVMIGGWTDPMSAAADVAGTASALHELTLVRSPKQRMETGRSERTLE